MRKLRGALDGEADGGVEAVDPLETHHAGHPGVMTACGRRSSQGKGGWIRVVMGWGWLLRLVERLAAAVGVGGRKTADGAGDGSWVVGEANCGATRGPPCQVGDHHNGESLPTIGQLCEASVGSQSPYGVSSWE